MDQWFDGSINGLNDASIEEWMDGMDEYMNGWMLGWIEGMDRWMNG